MLFFCCSAANRLIPSPRSLATYAPPPGQAGQHTHRPRRRCPRWGSSIVGALSKSMALYCHFAGRMLHGKVLQRCCNTFRIEPGGDGDQGISRAPPCRRRSPARRSQGYHGRGARRTVRLMPRATASGIPVDQGPGKSADVAAVVAVSTWAGPQVATLGWCVPGRLATKSEKQAGDGALSGFPRGRDGADGALFEFFPGTDLIVQQDAIHSLQLAFLEYQGDELGALLPGKGGRRMTADFPYRPHTGF